MAIKPPDGHLEWVTDDNSAKYLAPSAAKRLQGWIASEKPPFQFFNWAFRLIDRWLKWAETQSDEHAAAISANAVAMSAHAGATNAHGATAIPAADRIAMYTDGGRLQSGAAPSGANDCVRKADLDAVIPGEITARLPVFVKNANGNPNMSDTKFDVFANVAEISWESVGPTGSGAANIWTALDIVPPGAKWIRVLGTVQGNVINGNAHNAFEFWIAARKTGSAAAINDANRVCEGVASSDTAGYASGRAMNERTIQIDASGRFDIAWFCEFVSKTCHLYLVGYGY